MKKLMALLLAVGMTASIAGAQEVLSRNAVGYVKVDMEGSVAETRYYLLSMPFVSLDGSPFLLTEVFDAVPNNTILSLWDADTQSYDNYTRGARGAWLDDADTIELDPGIGVFVALPPGAPEFDVVLMGEVPDEDVSVARSTGFTLLGAQFPVETKLTNTVMATELPNNTIISMWNSADQSYVNYTKGARGSWLDEANDAVISPADGFFVLSDALPQIWTETKPYTWP